MVVDSVSETLTTLASNYRNTRTLHTFDRFHSDYLKILQQILFNTINHEIDNIIINHTKQTLKEDYATVIQS